MPDAGAIPSVSSDIHKHTGLYSIYCGVYFIVSEVFLYWGRKFIDVIISFTTKPTELRDRMDSATTYSEWLSAASNLDDLEGFAAWKNDPRSPHYSHELVENRLAQLIEARVNKDTHAMAFLLRTTLNRKFAHIGNPLLYTRYLTGTKKLIDNYYDEVVTHLEDICAEPVSSPADLHERINLFKNLRDSYGRSALLLSGGGSLGMYHVGVLWSLFQEGVLPQIISGASSGSIIAAIVCTHTDAEFPSLLEFKTMNLDLYEMPFLDDTTFSATARRFQRVMQKGAVFSLKDHHECLRQNIGTYTFIEAYRHSRRVLNVSVSSPSTFEMNRIFNYKTAPNVIIWTAVAASCSAPLLFERTQIMQRDAEGNEVPWTASGRNDFWIDGSIEADTPMKQLSILFNVNFFIVSQVNPHVFPFIHMLGVPSPLTGIAQKLMFLVSSELSYRVKQLIELGVLSKSWWRLHSLLAQNYRGHVTIVPTRMLDCFSMLCKHTVEVCLQAKMRSEQATWPSIPYIRDSCLLEFVIHDCLRRLQDIPDAGESCDEAPENVRPERRVLTPVRRHPKLGKAGAVRCIRTGVRIPQ